MLKASPALNKLQKQIDRILGRKNGDNIFYFISTYSLVVGISALVYQINFNY
jgi:hypothetical protein